MTILEALADPQLLGALPAFHDFATWRAWLVFLRAVYGLPMDEADLEARLARAGPRHRAGATAAGRRDRGPAARATAPCSDQRGRAVLDVRRDGHLLLLRRRSGPALRLLLARPGAGAG